MGSVPADITESNKRQASADLSLSLSLQDLVVFADLVRGRGEEEARRRLPGNVDVFLLGNRGAIVTVMRERARKQGIDAELKISTPRKGVGPKL